MPEAKRVDRDRALEITVPGYPGPPAWFGATINYRHWCESEVKRISKIPGHSPRIAYQRNKKGHYTGEILIVDDEFVLPEGSAATDRARIRQFYEKKSKRKSPYPKSLAPLRH